MEASELASMVSWVRDYLWNTMDSLQEANKWLDKWTKSLGELHAELLGIAGKKTGVPRKVSVEVAKRDNYQCVYCGILVLNNTTFSIKSRRQRCYRQSDMSLPKVSHVGAYDERRTGVVYEMAGEELSG